jgi:VWFA-related protein
MLWRMLVVLAALYPALTSQEGRYARVTQVDTTRYPEVTVYVSVTNEIGQPVTGLGASDFALTEAGNDVPLVRFAAGSDSPLSAALVIDRSGSMINDGKMNAAKDAARAFVGQMRPGDQTAIIGFSGGPETLEPFTNEQTALMKAIGPIRPDGPTALYDSIIAAVRLLGRAPTEHRTVILLTDGRDLQVAGNPQQQSRASLEEAIQAARDAQIAVMVVGLGAPATDPTHDAIDEAVLMRIASETGGVYQSAPDPAQLAALYRLLSTGLQQEYALTYRSLLPSAASQRTISVTVGSVAQITYQPYAPPPPLPPPTPEEPQLPLILLPIGLISAGIGATLLWRSRRMASRAPRPFAATGPTTMLEEPRFCIECGQQLTNRAKECSVCRAPVPAHVWE